jgi:hypothetical protein
MPTITWSNGQQDSASTWEALEELVRETQWRYYTPEGFRTAMAKRAWRWSRTEIDPDVDAETFFAELAHAKLVTIDDEPKDDGVDLAWIAGRFHTEASDAGRDAIMHEYLEAGGDMRDLLEQS